MVVVVVTRSHQWTRVYIPILLFVTVLDKENVKQRIPDPRIIVESTKNVYHNFVTCSVTKCVGWRTIDPGWSLYSRALCGNSSSWFVNLLSLLRTITHAMMHQLRTAPLLPPRCGLVPGTDNLSKNSNGTCPSGISPIINLKYKKCTIIARISEIP